LRECLIKNMKNKTKVIFFGYRAWALKIIESIKGHDSINCLKIIKSYEEYKQVDKNYFQQAEVLLFIGWSWIVEDDILRVALCLGIHPSDLPDFRGGSPIQHQIIQGCTRTKVSLMELSSKKLDAGDIWGKGDLSLEGSDMDEILFNISNASIKLLELFFNQYPDIIPVQQKVEQGSYFKRRKESDGRIDIKDLADFSAKSIYNKIRCLTYPYPNAYIEDSNGDRVYFEAVRFESLNKK
jgi:methionyl-tRNA formyltransferase